MKRDLLLSYFILEKVEFRLRKCYVNRKKYRVSIKIVKLKEDFLKLCELKHIKILRWNYFVTK